MSFNIKFSLMTDTKKALVSNIGRVIVKKLAVKFEGNKTLGVDRFHMFACYRDIWKIESEEHNIHSNQKLFERVCYMLKLKVTKFQLPRPNSF